MSTYADAHMHTLPPRMTLFGDGATTTAGAATEPDWTGALCQRPDVDPDMWFPEGGDSPEPAKRICQGCPLRAQCLEWSLTTAAEFGVWGGVDERERRKMLDGLAAADPAGPEMQPAAGRARGKLRILIAAHLDAWPTRAFTPTDLAKVFGRPRQSITHALATLERLGLARQVTTSPRRYASTAPRARTRAESEREQLRAQVREFLAAHPDDWFTCIEVTRGIGSDRHDAIRHMIARMQRRGELRVSYAQSFPRYAAAQPGAAQTEPWSCAS